MAGEYNNAPYLLRQSGGGLQYDFTQEIDKLIGGTVAWNQLVDISFAKTNNTDITLTKNSDFISITGTSANDIPIVFNDTGAPTIPIISGHKYLYVIKTANNVNFRAGINGYGYSLPYGNNMGIYSHNVSSYYNGYGLQFVVSAGTYNNEKFVPIFIDLTQAFGTEIADYVYNLEQTTEGSGIAWLKSHGFLTKDYYAYNTGSLVSVKTSEHRTTGKNLLKPAPVSNPNTSAGITYTVASDGSVRIQGTATGTSVFQYISHARLPLVQGETYVVSCNGLGSDLTIDLFGTDLEIPATADWVGIKTGISTDNTAFTLNKAYKYYRFNFIVSTGRTMNMIAYPMIRFADADATYEPYRINSYPLDSNLELRGIPKLDSGSLYYDGDVYESSGVVTRKYGIVDLGTLNWYQHGAGTDKYYTNGIPNGSPTNNLVCPRYVVFIGRVADMPNMTMQNDSTDGRYVYVSDGNFISNPTGLKSALSGVYLVYELATPTTEQAQAYENPQLVNPLGTEEYVDTRDVPIPVGHETFYPLEEGYGTTLISDLPSFGSGAIPSNLYLAVDDGENTTKIPVIDLVTRIVNSMN